MINWLTIDADLTIALIYARNPWDKGSVAKMNSQVIGLLDTEKLPVNPLIHKEPGHI